MARTKLIKKPCELCGKEYASSAMHQHLKKCRREHGLPETAETQPSEIEPVMPVTEPVTEPAKPAETQPSEIIIYTEPKPDSLTKQAKSGFDKLCDSVSDFVVKHDEEILPVVTTLIGAVAPGALENILGQQQVPQQQVNDARTWAEQGKW